MIKVLILYPFYNHNQLIDSLCDNLALADIEADSFEVITWRYKRKNKNSKPFLLSILSPFMVIPKVRGFLITLFRKRILLKISENYDIVDIHFYSSMFDEIISELKKRKKIIKITIWGSDFYRANKERREVQRKFYQDVDVIQLASQQMRNDFLLIYPEFTKKVRLAQFGIMQFDVIDELLEKGNSGVYKVDIDIPTDKIIISCGTNGHSAQQHHLILESISQLPDALKEKIFLLLPMTYGGDKKYLAEVNEKLVSLGVPFKLFSSPLSVVDVCKLRIVSDIAITIQKTDAFSAAVQEHIYAGGILISGEWLPYKKLKENGIFYIETKLETLTDSIGECIINRNKLKLHSDSNRVKMGLLSAWDSAITSWKEVYNEIGN